MAGSSRSTSRACLLAGGMLMALVAACRPAPLSPAAADVSGISGRVLTGAGGPASGAVVYAYRSPRGSLRGPADFAAGVDGEGRYLLDLTAGRYWLVARQRAGGGEAGPPRPGDAWSVYPGNPVVVASGALVPVDFRLGPASRPRLRGGALPGDSSTGISGRAVDAAGNPVAGITALVYRGPELHRMPDFTSPPTGADGRFVVHVPQGGRYCLALRSGTRGQPVAGDLYGLLAPREAPCRELATGELLEVGTVVVRPYRR